MRTIMRVCLAAGLHRGNALAVLLPVVAACTSSPVVEPAKTCADPCCDGPTAGIDCAQNPNLSCMEDADVCTARTYGCTNGSFFIMGPSQVPTSCASDGSADEVGFVFVVGD